MTAPAFARGVRFRRLADGQGVLLIPEGVVNLNATAAAIVELIDGKRTSTAIASDLSARFDADETEMKNDVEVLLRRFASQAWLVIAAAEQR